MTKEQPVYDLQGMTKIAADLEAFELKGLQELIEIQQIKQALIGREANRLTSHLGAEHRTVQKLRRRAAQSKDLLGRLQVKLEIAEIEIPEVGDNELLIHGRMMDEKLLGQKGFYADIYRLQQLEEALRRK